MASEGLQFESKPVRKATLPFFYTAPLALVLMGGLLSVWGIRALATPWSNYTLALTHVFTLGFLTMSCVGLVYLLLGVLGSRPTVPVWISHSVYWLLLAGAAGLIWGTAQARVEPVSFAISSVGGMGVLFLWHASRALRRAEVQGPTRRGLALALWGFFGLAFLGIWIAHGHAGMRFPGPRGLWTQAHALVGLLAWVGALLIAFSSEIWPRLQGGRPLSSLALGWLTRLIALGLGSLLVLLFVAYFFLPFESAASWEPWLILFFSPMVLAVWVLHPAWALHSLAGLPEKSGLLFWRTGLGLGPVVILSGLVAWTLGEPRWVLFFGWLALYGWAGLLVCGALVGAAGQWLRPSGAEPSSAGVVWLRGSFALHMAGLICGGVGIVSQSDAWARAAGVLVFLHGLELALWLLKNLRIASQEQTRAI